MYVSSYMARMLSEQPMELILGIYEVKKNTELYFSTPFALINLVMISTVKCK
jgi:hypothetical protein